MFSLNTRGWLRLILINILVSAVTAAIIVRLMTAQAGASAPAPAPAPSRAPATATVMPASAGVTALPATARPIATQPPASTAIPFNPTAALAQATSPAQSAPVASAGGVRIANVISPGQRQREVLSVLNEGGDAVNLENWTVQNGRGFSYKLPNITVFKEGFLNIYTTSGTNTPTDVFMRQNDSVWQVGDTVSLMNNGQVVSKFEIK